MTTKAEIAAPTEWLLFATPEERAEVQVLQPVIEAGDAARKKRHRIQMRCSQRRLRAPKEVKGVRPL